jgi:hypothetical protein
MDDLQFRRCVYADPNSKEEEILAAISADPVKQKFVKELKSMDDKLSSALDIPVPDDLYDKLILRQTLVTHQQQKRKTRVHLAMAASVAFAIGLSFNFTSYFDSYPTLGDYALAHTYHEAEYFSNNDEAKVTLASLNEKMSSFDGSFTESLGELISANFCRFNGMKSLHLTFKGVSAPVAVFIVPNDEDLAFSENFSDQKMQGKSLRFKDSNIVIVADKNEALDGWQKKIDAKVRWSI